MEVATHRLRKKLIDINSTVKIHTLRGIGYILEDDSQ
ncbi:MAG: hypothetical protein N2B02_02930 [Amylibacter sp.]